MISSTGSYIHTLELWVTLLECPELRRLENQYNIHLKVIIKKACFYISINQNITFRKKNQKKMEESRTFFNRLNSKFLNLSISIRSKFPLKISFNQIESTFVNVPIAQVQKWRVNDVFVYVTNRRNTYYTNIRLFCKIILGLRLRVAWIFYQNTFSCMYCCSRMLNIRMSPFGTEAWRNIRSAVAIS